MSSRDDPSPASLALRRLLDERGQSAASLAREAGLPERSLRSWAAGGCIPRADRAGRLERATGGAVPADQW